MKSKPTGASANACLCNRRLSDVDLDVLVQLLLESVAECKRHGR